MNLTPETLLGLIRDAHARMATNRDKGYRKTQQAKIDDWLEKLSVMYENGEYLP